MIKLVDLLGIKEEKYRDYKIHLATGLPDRREPYNLFVMGNLRFGKNSKQAKTGAASILYR